MEPLTLRNTKFFDGKINFSLIRNATPSLIPQLSTPLDISNFRTFTSEEQQECSIDESMETGEEGCDDACFKDFTPIARDPGRALNLNERVSKSEVTD